jgi:hypothetical protein
VCTFHTKGYQGSYNLPDNFYHIFPEEIVVHVSNNNHKKKFPSVIDSVPVMFMLT